MIFPHLLSWIAMTVCGAPHSGAEAARHERACETVLSPSGRFRLVVTAPDAMGSDGLALLFEGEEVRWTRASSLYLLKSQILEDGITLLHSSNTAPGFGGTRRETIQLLSASGDEIWQQSVGRTVRFPDGAPLPQVSRVALDPSSRMLTFRITDVGENGVGGFTQIWSIPIDHPGEGTRQVLDRPVWETDPPASRPRLEAVTKPARRIDLQGAPRGHRPLDFAALNPQNGELMFTDRSGLSIVTFGADGQFVRSIPMPTEPAEPGFRRTTLSLDLHDGSALLQARRASGFDTSLLLTEVDLRAPSAVARALRPIERVRQVIRSEAGSRLIVLTSGLLQLSGKGDARTYTEDAEGYFLRNVRGATPMGDMWAVFFGALESDTTRVGFLPFERGTTPPPMEMPGRPIDWNGAVAVPNGLVASFGEKLLLAEPETRRIRELRIETDRIPVSLRPFAYWQNELYLLEGVSRVLAVKL